MARADRRDGRGSTWETIAGIRPVEESLAAGETIARLIVGTRRAGDRAVADIIRAAKAAGVPVTFEDEASFARFGDVRHQHVVALVRPYAYAAWSDVRAAVRQDPSALVVALDHVEDPHNLGAVMRNAEGAGALAVVIPDRRSASVTPAARRAAAGAASHLRVARVPNMVRALEDLKADGCWVYGLAAVPGATPYAEADLRGRCAIVVGAEGKGLSRLVAERCDRLLVIALHGKVKSLNASAAAAVALFEALRQRSQTAPGASGAGAGSPVNP